MPNDDVCGFEPVFPNISWRPFRTINRISDPNDPLLRRRVGFSQPAAMQEVGLIPAERRMTTAQRFSREYEEAATNVVSNPIEDLEKRIEGLEAMEKFHAMKINNLELELFKLAVEIVELKKDKDREGCDGK